LTKYGKGYTLSVRGKLVYSKERKGGIAMYYERIKTKSGGVVNIKVVIGTVDISKNSLTCYMRCSNGCEIKPFMVSNDLLGLSEFWRRLLSMKVREQMEEIIVGFESTGPYGEPLKNFMKDKPVKLVQINPMHTKRIKEIADNSPGSTDQKDPRVIADVIQLGHVLSVITPRGAAAELRVLTHTRDNQVKYKTALLNRLESLMFTVFPELVQTMKHLGTKTSRYLIRYYPTPEKLSKLSLSALTGKLRRISRGRLKETLAKKLRDASRQSLGVKEGQISLLIEIKHILTQLDETEGFIKELEIKMAEELVKIPYHKHLISLKGIKVVSLGGIIGEVGDFRNYHSGKELIKLAGLNLYEISSGKYMGLRRISKRGRWLLRKLLFYGALNVVRKGGILHDYYHRLINRGMKKIKALVAVMRKLLGIMFALVRDGTDYLENYKPKRLEVIKVPA
jgi:transposase